MPDQIASEVPRILEGLTDQKGDRWIIYGTTDCHVTFSLAELVSSPAAIFKKFSQVGSALLRNSSKDAFFKQIEAFRDFSQCLVLRQPGWERGMFLYGDGSICLGYGDNRRAVISADPQSRFGQSGDLETWRHRIGAIVQHQPLPLFVLSYACVGALLRYFPVDAQNPIVEIVGAHENGKSILVDTAGSVWGGGSEGVGFGENWDFSPAEFDQLAHDYRDTLLILNESNLAGTKRRNQAEAVKRVVFSTTDSGSRRRFRDPERFDHARVAVLSTTNAPLRDLVGADSKTQRAILSRVVTLDADRPHGIFDFVPIGFSSAKDAAIALDRHRAAFYGSAGRWFVWCLVERLRANGEDFTRDVHRRYERFLAEPSIARLPTARQSKIVAMTCVAHEAATDFGIFSAGWGSILQAVESLTVVEVAAPPQACAVDWIRTYLNREGPNFLRFDHFQGPLSRNEFESASGIWLGKDQFLVPTGTLQSRLPNYLRMLRKLREDGHLQSESGLQSKLSKKVPAAICSDSGRRAYFFHLAKA